MADSKYVVEYARSANSSCKGIVCKKKDIEDNSLRLGKLVRDVCIHTHTQHPTKLSLSHTMCISRKHKTHPFHTHTQHTSTHMHTNSPTPHQQQTLTKDHNATLYHDITTTLHSPTHYTHPQRTIHTPQLHKTTTHHTTLYVLMNILLETSRKH